MLYRNFDISDLRPANYNPRKIDDKSIDRLCESIKELGLIKPIIARGRTIVAGHQRATALKKLGITQAPTFILQAEANIYDEIRFNQLHNGTDMDVADSEVRIAEAALSGLGFIEVAPIHITGNYRAMGANIRAEISRLILKYGSWGACVATRSGEVIHCQQYAMACGLVKKPLLVYVIKDSEKQKYKDYLCAEYGEFNYSHLEKKTYMQTYAQLYRLRKDNQSKRNNRSPAYEKLIIPLLEKNPHYRVLDFGCGQGDYVKRLQKMGYPIIGFEPFRRVGGQNNIDIRVVEDMAEELFASIRKNGRFDIVVCDYVLNSVDTCEAENDVLNTINAFTKIGGYISISGRAREQVEGAMRSRVCNSHKRYVEFIDTDGFSGLYRKGEWFYQKFHTQEQVRQICKERQWEIVEAIQPKSAWTVMVRRRGETLPQGSKKSFEREFNMRMSKEGTRLNKNKQAIDIYKLLV